MLININGIIAEGDAKHFTHNNRSFLYGDGVFESLVVFDNQIPLIKFHSQRIAKSAEILEIKMPEPLQLKFIEKSITELCLANQYTNARIRITLFRKNGGYYIPSNHEAEFTIVAEPIDNNQFQFNETGLSIGVYSEILKPINILSSIKSCNALLYIKAGLYFNKLNWNDCVIINEKNNICEGNSSSIFWVKNKKIYTPALTTGCVDGVMRKFLLQQWDINNFEWEEGNYLLEAIINADEVFISNATKGMQWIKQVSFNDTTRTYSNEFTKELFQLLTNDILELKI